MNHARTFKNASCSCSTKMAVPTKGPELGGYDYDFIISVPEDWICLVCHLAMKDPVQIVGCGHRLCNICMESLFR